MTQELLRLPPGEKLLLPYQARWLEDRSPLKIGEKSRRVGLTWAEAADAVIKAARATGGSHHYYLGTGKEMAKEFIDAAAQWAVAFNHAASEIQEEVLREDDRDILVYRIDFASGNRVEALSSRPATLRGRQGNLTVDEAAHHDQLQEVLKAANAFTMWGGKVRVISTHNGAENYFNELILDSRAGKKEYSLHRITIRDACREGLYRRICLVKREQWSAEAEEHWIQKLLDGSMTREDADEEYMCVPRQRSGAYLPPNLVEACMVDEAPVLRFEGSADFNGWPERMREDEILDWCEEWIRPLFNRLDPTCPSAFGVDFGRKANRTSIAPVQTRQNLATEVPFVVELQNVPYRQQEQVLFFVADGLPRLISGALDARGNGGYLAEQAGYKYGSRRVEAVQFSQGWYLENMPRFKSAFEDRTITIPRDRDILDDLRAIQVINGIPMLPKTTGQQRDRHGDSAIALVLGHYAARREPVVYEYHRVPRPSQMRHDRRFRDGDWRRVKTTGGFWRGAI